MTQIKTSMMVLFLLCLTSFTLEKNLSRQSTNYYIIRNEWDDRCVSLVNGLAVLGQCGLGESIWIGNSSGTTLRNYYSGKYLAFQPGNPNAIEVVSPTTKNEQWSFIQVHQRNRRWPSNQSYWGVRYYVLQNSGTRLCLMVDGNNLLQKNCNPERPEHLSYEKVPFNALWRKNY